MRVVESSRSFMYAIFSSSAFVSAVFLPSSSVFLVLSDSLFEAVILEEIVTISSDISLYFL